MIVDDEPDIVATVKRALKSHGYTTDGFTNPVEAVQDFADNSEAYALVISDIRMPGMNGFEFAKNVKRIRQDVSLVLMTAFEINKPEFASLFPSTPVSELVKKPFANAQLLSIARKYVGITEQH